MARLDEHSDRGPRWRPFVGTLAAIVLGVILLLAAWGKALDPEAFTEQIRVEGLDFFGRAALVAYAAIVAEVALGASLLLGLRRRWVLLPTAALVVFFLFLTGRAYWRSAHGLLDPAEACGCFGNLLTRTPAEAFWQDLVLLGLPITLVWLGRSPNRSTFPARRLAMVGLLTVAGLIFTLRAPHLPLDDWATRLRPGVQVQELCAGGQDSSERLCLDALIPQLDAGRHWVVISSLEEDSFLEEMPRLNALALAGDLRLWVITAAAPQTLATFSWTQGPAFEVREAPATLLRPLHRRLPRSFLVEAGTVVDTVAGLPPESI